MLEHSHGAVLLAALLLGHPVSGLGIEVTPREPAADPLPTAAALLRDAHASTSSHGVAARFVMATFSALAEIDKDTVTRVVFE